jgi:NhaA family Na+:H+ antiporter
MATDIAFVVGALMILGKRVPHGLKVFLLTLAIVDDIIAVLVIAIFYTSQLSLIWFFFAVVGLIIVVFMNRLGVRNVFGYLFVGSLVWFCTLKSGIHPTISGVALGLLTPAIPLLSKDELQAELTQALEVVRNMSSGTDQVKLRVSLEDTDFVARESISPLERFEADIHPWAAFLIMPIFALANAGVPFSINAISSPIAIAVALALVVGKPLGIVLSMIFVVSTKLGSIPGDSNWKVIIGAGCLAGIGFTMSLFVASLSLDGRLLVEAKAGIMIGSAIAGILGILTLVITLKHKHFIR